MHRNLTDIIKLPTSSATTNGGLDLESVNDTTAHTSSVYLDMLNYRQGIAFFIVHTNSGTTDSLSCGVVQATAAAGTGSKALSGAGYAAGTAAAASADYVVMVPFNVSMMDANNDFRYVAATFTASGNTDTLVVSSFIVRTEPRYANNTLPA